MLEVHTLHPTVLREYDIRGLVDDTLKVEDVRIVGRAFGTRVVRAGGRTVAVGYDGRLSSPKLEAALVEGLTACGLQVKRVGRGPTPMLYFASHELATDAAVMITGSHNPPEYNGIKMVLQGKSFYGADIQGLGELAAAGDFANGEGADEQVSVTDAYVERLLDGIDLGTPMKVAWDPGNGAAGEVLRMLCDRLPGEHIILNETIDGNFPAHHPDPTVEKNLAQLKRTVLEDACDLGIGFDGDGDRVGVIDAKGRVLWGDQLLVILATEVLADLPGSPIIADVKASQVFSEEIARMGGKPLLWRSGHSLIKAKMAELDCPLAGEMSGHIFFAHRYYGFDDALYAALRLLSIVGRAAESIADMRDRLPATVNTPELRFPCPEERKFEVIDEVKARLDGQGGLDILDIDGVRVQSDDGWWLLRASNTQDVLVARCEAADIDALNRLKAALAAQVKASGLPVPEF